MSPTQLTLRYLRKRGWTAQVVEHWNPHARVRQDLFGVVDVIAIRPGQTLAVQTTTAPNVSARVRKIHESEHVGAMRDAGWDIVVHGWAKDGRVWALKREVDCTQTKEMS